MTERIPNLRAPQRMTVEVPELPRIVLERPRLSAEPVIRQIKVPVTRALQPPVTTQLAPPVVDVPQWDPPSYEPIDTEAPLDPNSRVGGGKGDKEEKEEEPADTRDLPDSKVPAAETPVINVPVIGEVPVPTKETVILSGTTAVATVAATLIGKEVATRLLGWMKPVVKQLFLRGKKLLTKDLTPYETQELLAFEGEKKLMKRLQKEQKQEKLRQASVHQAPPRQRIRMRMEKKDGSRPQP